MLTLDRPQLLAGVGANSPMGSLLRQYWVPAIRSERLDAGGAPVRLRISGENLVAFRAHDGRVGIFDEGCPHRGVSLSLARNEDNALRCIFHGWKIDVTGKLVDIPTEPSERCAAFAESVKFGRYQTHEEGGIVWAWLGRGEAPVFPTFAFAGLPAAHVISFVGLLGCHWLQALEMLLDPVHIGICIGLICHAPSYILGGRTAAKYACRSRCRTRRRKSISSTLITAFAAPRFASWRMASAMSGSPNG